MIIYRQAKRSRPPISHLNISNFSFLSFLIPNLAHSASYLPSHDSGFSFAVSLRNWNWRISSCPTRPNAWRVLTF